MKKYNDALDMDILVRKKPFREEKQGGFVNDVDSEDESNNADKNRVHSEFLGGRGESDCDEQEDTEGDLTIRRQALNKKSLQECKAVLSRSNEVERANAPGRTKEADAQIKTMCLLFKAYYKNPWFLRRQTILHGSLLCCCITLPISRMHKQKSCERSNLMILKLTQKLI